MTKIDEKGRQAVIVALVQRGKLGRTAIMKMMYLLQEVRSVPLRYRFRIYTYGPYDSQVLEDLQFVELREGVVCEPVRWHGGSGVEIRSGNRASYLLTNAFEIIEEFKEDIDWVYGEFSGKSASDLEVISTIIFVNRSLSGGFNAETLTEEVHSIKPHHSAIKISQEIQNLEVRGYLKHSSH